MRSPSRLSSTLSRRAFASLAAGVAGLAWPALEAQTRPETPKPEKSKITIAVGGQGTFCYLPLTIGQQLGFFKAQGVTLEIQDFSGGARALVAVASGTADVCSGAFEHTICQQNKNQMFRAFVQQSRAPQIAFGVSVRNLPTYRAIPDLKGKRIGVSTPGSATHRLALLALLRGGLKADDVEFIGVGTAEGAMTALRTGLIDALSNADPLMSILVQKNEIKVITDTRSLKASQDVFGGPMPAACLYAPVDFLETHPKTCQALTNAVMQSLKWLQTAGPGDLMKTIPESYWLGDRALYLAAFYKARESISVDGLMPAQGPATALKALMHVAPDFKPEKIKLPQTYSNDWVVRAKERFKL